MRSFRPAPILAWLLLLGLVLPAVGRAAPADSQLKPRNTQEWLDRMAARYAQFENKLPSDLEELEGTGFNVYQRARWLMEPRLDPVTGDEEPGARWEAWKQLRQMESTEGTRSTTWFNVGPVNVSGRCLALAIDPTDPNIVYAGFASSGIWKTINAGASWTVLADTLPTLAVSALKIDPTDHNRIWMGTGEGWGNVDGVHGVGVLVSTDAGASWGTTGLSSALSLGKDVFALEYNPDTGTLMAATGEGLYRSTDQGTTFGLVESGGNWRGVELQRGSNSVMFACVDGITAAGFYRSTDDGATWTQTTTGTPTSDIGNSRFALSAANPNVIEWAMASAADGTQKGIWRSTDAGLSFTQVYGTGGQYSTQGWYDVTIALSPTDANKTWSGGVYFYSSTDGGTTFSQVANNVHVDHHATAYAPSNPNIFWVGSDGGVWKSTNGGTSFTDVNAGLVTLQLYDFNQAETDPTLALGGTQDNGTWLYNGSTSWSHVIGGDGFHTEIDRVNPNYMYGELYYGSHYRSTNTGSSFTAKNTGITDTGKWDTPTWMDFSNPAIIWTAHTNKIYRTTDRMNTWVDMNSPTGLNGGRNIHQCQDVPSMLVVLGANRIWVTTDTGATWVNKTGTMNTGSALSDVYVHPHDPNTFVVTIKTYNGLVHQVYKTTNMGSSWTAIDTGLPNEPVNAIEMDPSHPERYFIGTDLGVYYSSDAGTSWVPFNTGLPHVVVDDLRLHNDARILRAGTHGRGLWEVDLTDLDAASAPDPHPAIQPLTLRIFGNPASRTATLRYGTRQPGKVHLAIYDLQGRELKTVLNEYTYGYLGTLEVNVSDIPNCVYFARLASNGHQISQKLVIER
jgi:hypothetical protein